MDLIQFIVAVENGSMDNDTFIENVQEFVDSNIWEHLQGSWHRTVMEWVALGYATI